mgnify:CR=1 FL=1
MLFKAVLHVLISIVILVYYFIVFTDFIFYSAHLFFPFIEHRLELTEFYAFHEVIH